MPWLLTKLINVTGVFLYPAYESYKALARRPVLSQDADLERWLQYWALVGAWTAAEGAIGFLLTWIPFYTIGKTLIFLYLALGSRGTPYVYNNVLAPLFAEHEPTIDEFIAGVRGQAGSHARGTFGWLYDFIRRQLGLTEQQAANLSQAVSNNPSAFAGAIGNMGGGGGHGAGGAGTAHPPTFSDPASGVAQQAYGLVSGLAGKYMPAALGALNAASQNTARGFDVPPTPGPAPSAPAGSRTFQYAMQETTVSSREGGDHLRTPGNSSDGSLSGSGGSNLASSYTEIRREEVEGISMAVPANRRTSSSSWMRWGKDDKDGKQE